MKKRELYLDANATTPVHPDVLHEMLPFFTEFFGNASSRTHSKGWHALQAVEKARGQVAALIGAEKEEVFFTSGATEALNLSIYGLASQYSQKGKHIITYATEHKAVLEPLEILANNGFEITFLGVDNNGLPDLVELKNKLRPDTIFVAAMLANNETGVIFPIKEMKALCKEVKAFFLCDATQAVGKIPVDVNDLGVDILVYSAHKLYGPKGVGVLYKRRKNPRVSLMPLLQGGGQENGIRPGTYNVPGIIGLGKASERARECLTTQIPAVERLKEQLESFLVNEFGAVVHGCNSARLPNTINFHVNGLKAETAIRKLPHLAFSTGSACNSALPNASHVLKAMHYTEEEAFSSMRFSVLVDFSDDDLSELINSLREFKASF